MIESLLTMALGLAFIAIFDVRNFTACAKRRAKVEAFLATQLQGTEEHAS